jgi:catechol 2,3-dioxygenase-like lactoylglutathione lyase family enzyme
MKVLGAVVAALVLWAGAATAPGAVAAAQAAAGVATAATRDATVTAIDSVAIPVADMERAVDFYTQVLAFHVVADHEVTGSDYEHFLGVFGVRLRVVRLALGEEAIELMQFLTPRGRALPADLRSNDAAFQHVAIIVSDMDQAYAWLRQHHVEHASTAPQRLPDSNPNAGGIAAFYFRDPDGNFLEILHFPPGKGERRWQSRAALFLGIDHTAIVVADTAASLHHYRDLLGLSVAGASDNSGPEQEHLNNVFGAHLRITALRAQHGPGVELLEYLAPRTGRPIPVDSQANDHWYWQINCASARPEALYERLRGAHVTLVSSGIVTLPAPAFNLGRGFVARDPDGHAAAIASQAAP